MVVDPQGGFTDVLRIDNESMVTTHVLDASVERVWDALQLVYEELEIPVDELDEARRLIGAVGYRARRIAGERMARYVDCAHHHPVPRERRRAG